MRSAAIRILLVTGTILLAVRAPLALTVEKASLEKLVRDSHLIVMGKVLSSKSVWEGNNIYTHITVRINGRLKGNYSAHEVTVKQLGGKVGEVGEIVDGSPTFRPGEEVILLLVSWQDAFWVHSIVLGKFAVLEENGERYAMNDLRNIGLIDPVTKHEIMGEEVKTSRIPLGSFLTEIRSLVGH